MKDGSAHAMAANSRVDLQQLKERLAKLGVHIDTGTTDGLTGSPSSRADKAIIAQQNGSSWSNHLDRNKHEVMQLLERCNRIEAALVSPDNTGKQYGDSRPLTDRGGSRLTKVQEQEPTNDQQTEAVRVRANPSKASRTTGLRAEQDQRQQQEQQQQQQRCVCSPGRDALKAARRTLATATAGMKQAVAAMGAGAEAGHAASAAAGGTASAGHAGGTVRCRPSSQAGRLREDAHSSPVATLLSQYKAAQASWAQEKAKLRRDAVSARKRAAQLELENSRLQKQSQARAMDVSTLRAALKGRDIALAEAEAKAAQLEEALARCHEVAAEKLCGLASERDDLQALLLATLSRLEAVEGVVTRADESSAAMEEKVHELEGERLAALEEAAAARDQVTELREAQRRLAWQTSLLEKMSQVQLRHNMRKSAAIKELLGKGSTLPSGIKEQMGIAAESSSGSDDGKQKPIYDVLASLLGACENSMGMGEGPELTCSSMGESTDEAASLLAELGPALARGS